MGIIKHLSVKRGCSFFFCLSSTLLLLFLPSCYLFSQSADSLFSRFREKQDNRSRFDFLYEYGSGMARKYPDSTLNLLVELEEWVEETDDSLNIAKLKNLYGVVWYYKDQFDLSSKYYLEALSYTSLNSDNLSLLIRLNNNIAWNLQSQGFYDQALPYYNKSLSYFNAYPENIGDDVVGLLYNNKGVLFRNLQEYDSALICFRKSLLFNKKGGIEDLIAYNFNNISNVFFDLKMYDSSLYYLELATPMNYQRGDQREIILNLINYGKLFAQNSQYDRSEDSLTKGLELSIKYKQANLRQELLEELSILREYQGNFEDAIISYKWYTQLSDSLIKDDILLKLRELEIREKVQQNELALQLAERENKEQRILILGISLSLVFLIIAIILLINGLSARKKANERLKKLNDLLQEKNRKISDQNRIIQENATQLRSYAEKVKESNLSLEEIVETRTTKLKERNEAFLHYAKMNAHDVRGPLARILGLIQLIEMENDTDVILKYVKLIGYSARELDEVINHMNEVLKNEDVDFL